MRNTNSELLDIWISVQPNPADRLTLAGASIATALDCLRASPPDVAAARMFVMDALAQIERAEGR